MSLDGALWAGDGVPWMIFCHEWIQIEDGTMGLVRLKPDLSGAPGSPKTLFQATGPWKQIPEPLFKAGGGHGMIFETFDGRLMLVLHQPNSGGNERARFFELEDTGGAIRLKK